MTLANFLGCFFEEDAVTSGNGSAGQIRILIIAAAKETEELSFFLLFIGRAGSCGSRGSETRGLLEVSLNARIQLGNRTLEPVESGRVEFFSFIVLVTDVAYFTVYRGNFLFKTLQNHEWIVSVGFFVLIGFGFKGLDGSTERPAHQVELRGHDVQPLDSRLFCLAAGFLSKSGLCHPKNQGAENRQNKKARPHKNTSRKTSRKKAKIELNNSGRTLPLSDSI